MAKRLSDIAHREDPSRPTVSACNSPSAAVNGFADALDVMGINYNIDQLRQQSKDGFGGVRNRLGTFDARRIRFVSRRRGQGENQESSDNQCTSYDLDRPPWGHTAQTSLLALKNHPWIAGEFVWTGFDYIGEPTPYTLACAVVVFRHHRSGGFSEGSVLHLPVAVDRQADGPPAAALELGAIRR